MTKQVISQQPPGGRCTLYAGYADALARHFSTHAELVFSEARDSHGNGFPSLWLNGAAVNPRTARF
jgi:cystathionine gamma-synthase